MLNYGFIGLGNMSGAIIKGMIDSKQFQPQQIFGMNRSSEKTTKLVEELHINGKSSIEELITSVDVIILGVKPQNLDDILSEVNHLITPNQIIISIAAGKNLDALSSKLPNAQSIFRVMPNINAIVGASTSCYSTDSTSVEDKRIVETIFSAVGTILELPESQFSTFTTIACASPAFSYLYIDSLARAAVKEGMRKDLALQIAASSVLGSAKMISQATEHPWTLIDQVCSPGGTTIQGVTALQQFGFERAIYEAVDAVSTRDAELNKKNKE